MPLGTVAQNSCPHFEGCCFLPRYIHVHVHNNGINTSYDVCRDQYVSSPSLYVVIMWGLYPTNSFLKVDHLLKSVLKLIL